jgi:hypothetical protein
MDPEDDYISPYLSGLAHSITGIARPVRPTRPAEGARPGHAGLPGQAFRPACWERCLADESAKSNRNAAYSQQGGHFARRTVLNPSAA